jgi:DHA2 family multidrug resistance protein
LPDGLPTLQTLAALNASVTRQAAMIAYNNDFKLMTILSLASIPLVLLLRKGRVARAEPVAIE